MPNRILREGIITSEAVNSLSWPAEVFYRRLMSVVDDYGRYYGKPELLRAACYPLQLDKVGNQDVAKWIRETEETGLVKAYTIEGKDYLEVVNFNQQVRAKNSKFPSHDKQVHSRCVADVPVVGVEDVDEDGGESRRARKKFVKPALPEIRQYCEEIGAKINPVTFFNHYETNGWKVGKNSMKDWQAAVRGWNSREK